MAFDSAPSFVQPGTDWFGFSASTPWEGWIDFDPGEVIGWGIEGSVLNTELRLLLQGIKVAGAYCRGEQTVAETQIQDIVAVALEALKGGLVRGVTIEILQRLTGNRSIAALGLMIGTEAFPTLLQVLRGEITLQTAIAKVGLKMLTAGVVTAVVLVYPQVGLALVGAIVLKAIWDELLPEWKAPIEQSVQTTVQEAQHTVEAMLDQMSRSLQDLLGFNPAAPQPL